METTTFTIRGLAPLLMRNGDLVDPFNRWAREIKRITDKPAKQRTDENKIEAARLEFMGGLYIDEKGHPVIPGENIEALLVEAAKIHRLGRHAKAALYVSGAWPLIYKGPRNADALWADQSFRFAKQVGVNAKRVMRMRPIFREWSLQFELTHDASIINDDSVLEILATAGSRIGLGDWRPRFGRFEVV